jgi:hypothetical protein
MDLDLGYSQPREVSAIETIVLNTLVSWTYEL